jgi:hypothetical protein
VHLEIQPSFVGQMSRGSQHSPRLSSPALEKEPTVRSFAMWLDNAPVERTHAYTKVTLAPKEQTLAKTSPLLGTPSPIVQQINC